MDHGRDPCPWVILNDFGGAFCMGVSSPLNLALHRGNPVPLQTPWRNSFDAGH